MKRIVHTLVLFITLVSAPQASRPASAPAGRWQPVPAHEHVAGVYGGTAAQRAAIGAAIAVFAEAGLELPSLRILVHDTPDRCLGHPGIFDLDHRGDRIDLCTEDAHVLYHELAHAWERHAVDDATRRAFLDHVGLERWNGGEWEDNGIEWAANAIAAGLRLPPLTAGRAPDHREELVRYHILTGEYSPRYPHPVPEDRPATADRDEGLASGYAALRDGYGAES